MFKNVIWVKGESCIFLFNGLQMGVNMSGKTKDDISF